MQRINRNTLILIGFSVVGLAGFAQEAPAPQTQQQATPAHASRGGNMARREANQKLVADFGTAVKNGSLAGDDLQKAQSALAALQQRHGKGAPRDPRARHQAMKTVRTISGNPGLRAEDRDVLARDLAALKPARQ